MSELAATQKLFSEALFSPDKPLDEITQAEFGSESHLVKRFAVYRNNVHHSLVVALADTYPVIKKLIGDQAFQAVAQAYVLSSPPSSAVLIDFADGFADFLRDFDLLKQLLYLSDVARLEYFWLKSYHASDHPSLRAEALQTFSEITLNALELRLHPSLYMLQSSYAVGSIWQLNQDGTDLKEQLDVTQPESIVLVRSGEGLEMAVQLFILEAAYIEFLKSIKAGYTLAEAMAISMQAYPDFNLSEALAFFLNNEFFCALEAQG